MNFKAIGFGKVLLILILMVSVGGMLFYDQFILKSKIVDSQREASRVSSELSSLQQKTIRMKEGFEFFQAEQEKYIKINQIGFFNIQGRFEARQRLEAILTASNLLSSSKYSLKPAKPESYDLLANAGYQILSSEIDLELHATKDLDIYTYLFYLTNGFPGIITINSLEIVRSEEITQPVLRKLGTDRDSTTLVTAKVNATWRSATQTIEGFSQESMEEEF